MTSLSPARASLLARTMSAFRRSRPAAPKRSREVRLEVLESRIAPAAIITATLNDNTIGPVLPGSTIHYTEVIVNSGDAAAVNLQVAHMLEHASFVPGSMNISPLAGNDSYDTFANTTLVVGAATPSSPAKVIAGTLFSNDIEFRNDLGALDTFTLGSFSATSEQGGTVSVNADGTFSYTPKAGFVGTDKFTYTITDDGVTGLGTANSGALTDTATVTITVNGTNGTDSGPKIWYVDNSYAGANGPSDGTSLRPLTGFTSATAAQNLNGAGDLDGPGDILYFRNTTGSAANYTGGLTLEANQTLQGESDALIVNGVTLKTGGSTPVLSNIGGTILTLGTNNTLKGFSANNTSANNASIDILGSNFGTLTVSNVTIEGHGKALDLTNGTLAATFNKISSISSGTQAIKLTGIDGSLNTTLAGELRGSTADTVSISGGALSFSYLGTVTSTTAHSVAIVSKTNGTVRFLGAVSDTGTGILLQNNTGATVNFSGGVTVSTSGAGKTAFSATGGGSISVTGSQNTLSAANSTALEVQNTTITGLGLQFKSISANGGSGPGILLNNTGSNAGLTVTGLGDTTLGGDGSGGTIQNISGHGISLSNTLAPSFTNVKILNTAGSGVRGVTGVKDFTFKNGTINSSGTGGGVQESNIAFNDPTGTATDAKVTGNVTITGNVLTNALWHGVSILQFDGLLQDVNVSGNTISSGTTTGTGGNSFGSGIQLFTGGTATTVASVAQAELNNNTITNFPGGVLIAVQGGTSSATNPSTSATINGVPFFGVVGSATRDIEITNNILNGGGTTSNGAGGVVLPNQLILATVNGRGQGNFKIQNNGTVADPMSGAAGNLIDISAGGAVTVQALVSGNQLDAAGQTVSGTNGIAAGVGPFTLQGGTVVSTATLYATVQNNTVKNSLGSGIRMNVNAGDPTLNAIIKGNNVSAPISSTYGIQIVEGNNTGFTGNVNLEISGNTSKGGSASGTVWPGIGLRKFGTTAGEFAIVGLSPSPATNAQVEAYVSGQNPGSSAGTFGTGGTAAINGSSSNWTSIASVPQPATVSPLLFAPEPAKAAEPVASTPPDATPTTSAPTTSVVPEPVPAEDGYLSPAELQSLVAAAIQRWEATGLTPEQSALLHSISFEVGNLSGHVLGVATPGHITLDNDAAGNGWFVDSTPLNDSEFASSTGWAASHVDALTTVMHELGHQLGLDDSYAAANSHNLMYGYLTLGTRHLPSAHQADGAVPNTHATADYIFSPYTIGTLPAGKSVSINFAATVENPFQGTTGTKVSAQGTITGSGNISVTTNDFGPPVANGATLTSVDLPDVNVSVSPASVDEDADGNLVFTFTRQGPLTAALTSSFQLSGTAGTTSDYTVSGATTYASATGIGTVTFAANASTASITIKPTADTTVEGDETVIATITSGNGYDIGASNSATSIILNDDTSVAVSTSSAPVYEDAAGNLVYTFTRAGKLTAGQVVNFTLAGTAEFADSDFAVAGQNGGFDYNPASNSGYVTFGAGETTKTITLYPTADNKVESDETATVVVTSGTGYNVAGSPATAFILNDDSSVTIAVSPGSVAEDGTSNLVYTLTRAGYTGNALSVNLNVSGTAGLTGDYTHNFTNFNSSTGAATVTFAAGSSTATVTIDPTADANGEPDETVILTLANNAQSPASSGGYTLDAVKSATGRILNDDTQVSVAIGTDTTAEGAGTDLVYTFTRTGDNSTALPINFGKSGTALFTSDYTATSSASTFDFAAGTLTIPAGQSSVTVTLAAVDDRLVEGSETATLAVTAGSGYAPVGSSATGSIGDNDTATVSFATASSSSLESAGTHNVGVTLSINATGTGPIGLASALTVNLTNTAGGTATSGGTDYRLPTSPAVTFDAIAYPSGTETKNASIAITDDFTVEGSETANLGLSIAQNIGTQASVSGTVAHALTIDDNDFALVSFSVATSSVTEGTATRSVVAVLSFNATGTTGSFALAQPVSVNLSSLTGGTAVSGSDFTLPTTPSFTFAAATYSSGQDAQTASISVVDDRMVEGPETASLGLTIAQGIGAQVSVGGITTHTVTIGDNDSATLGFASSSSSVTEGASTQTVPLSLIINASGTGPIGLSSSVTANLTTTGGTAIAGTDYTLPASPAVTFAAGPYPTGSASQNAVISIADDQLVEAAETVGLGLSVVQNLGGAVTPAGVLAHTLTINDNDTATISAIGGSVTEGNSGTSVVPFTISLSKAADVDITVQFSTSDGTATVANGDYVAQTLQTVTIPAGQTSVIRSVVVNGDTASEPDETFTASISSPSAPGHSVTLGTATATGTILNDDTTVSVALGTTSVGESDTTGLVYTFTRTGPTSSALTVNFAASGTASAADYSVLTNGAFANGLGTVTFAPGSSTATVTLKPNDDRSVEGNETAILTVAPTTGLNIGGSPATGTINDNDSATISFTAANSSVNEGAGTHGLGLVLNISGTGTGPLTLERDVTLNVTTATGGTATGSGTDYTLPSVVTFAANSTDGATQTASLGLFNDALVEGSETVNLGLALGTDNTGGRVSLGSAATHTLTIDDNDQAAIGYASTTSTVGEGTANNPLDLVLTINANGTGTPALARDVKVDFTSISGTATAGGTDYTLPATVTFAAGATSGATRTASLTIINDSLVEGSETANLGLAINNDGTGGQAKIATGATATHEATITDNDNATISYSAATSGLGEGGENVALGYTLNIIPGPGSTGTPGLARAVTFNATSTGGTATNNSDYTLPTVLTFAANSGNGATTSGNLAILNDAAVEGAETVVLGATIANDATGGQVKIATGTSHTTTIDDNDTATIGYSTATSSRTEGDVSSVGSIGLVLKINANGTGTPVLERAVTFDTTTLTGGTAISGTDYQNPTSLTFAVGSLNNATLNVNLPVTNDTVSEGTETANLGLVIRQDPTGGKVTVDPSASSHLATILDNDVDFLVSGAGPTTNVVAGSGAGNVVFTFTVKNSGLTDATNVVVSDVFNLPAGTTFVNGVTSAGIFNPAGFWTIPTLAAGGTATLTVSFTAASSTAHNATISANASITASGQQTVVNTGDDQVALNATVVRKNDLSVEVTDGPIPPRPTTSWFTRSRSPTMVRATPPLPPCTTFPSRVEQHHVDGGFQPERRRWGNKWQWEPQSNVEHPFRRQGRLHGDGHRCLEHRRLYAGQHGQHQRKRGHQPGQQHCHGFDLHWRRRPAAYLHFGCGGVHSGSDLKYALTYQNGGYVTATGVKLSDIIPANTTFDLANSTAGWTDSAGAPLQNGAVAGTAILFPVGSLPVGAAAPITGTVYLAVKINNTVTAGAASITNTASISDDHASGADITATMISRSSPRP